MNKHLKMILVLIQLTTISGCAGRLKEQFDESFFTFQDKGKNYFSFILKLKGMKNSQGDTLLLPPIIPGDNRNSNKRALKREMEKVAVPENPEDARVPLKFRMEEMAHQKLNAKLQSTNYCQQDIKIEVDEYTRYKYKIKGFCLE